MLMDLVVCYQQVHGGPKPPFIARVVSGVLNSYIIESTERGGWGQLRVHARACSSRFEDFKGLQYYVRHLDIRRADAKRILDVGEHYFKHRRNTMSTKDSKEKAAAEKTEKRVKAVSAKASKAAASLEDKHDNVRKIADEAKSGGSVRTKPNFEEADKVRSSKVSGKTATETKISGKAVTKVAKPAPIKEPAKADGKHKSDRDSKKIKVLDSNPKLRGGRLERFEMIRKCKTVAEAKELGMTSGNILFFEKAGIIQVA